MKHYTFDNLAQVTADIIQQENRLIYLAGASASGKSYIGEELVKQLTESGKKVLLISSDSYYSDSSNLKYMLYGTFDHPKLIDYDLLQSDIEWYFKTGAINIPSYSFVEKRRTHLTAIDDQFDIVIVEGLYTIDQLHDTIIDTQWSTISAYKIFVHSSSEEVIFRRLLRDQARVKEPLHTIIGVMSNVFPMRTLFGETQETKAHTIITNDYKVIEKEGTKSSRRRIEKDAIPTQWLDKIYYMTDYIYNDSNDDNGKIIISEVYRELNGLLDHVIIHKRNSDPRQEDTVYESISLSLYQPAISTELHTLLQLAGLEYEWSYNKKVSYFINKKENNPIIIKEKFGIFYQLTW
jgi:uridine kinase